MLLFWLMNLDFAASGVAAAPGTPQVIFIFGPKKPILNEDWQ